MCMALKKHFLMLKEHYFVQGSRIMLVCFSCREGNTEAEFYVRDKSQNWNISTVDS